MTVAGSLSASGPTGSIPSMSWAATSVTSAPAVYVFAAMTVVYRSMKDDGEGMPLCGPTARTLGVRIEGDVSLNVDGLIEPGTGGMSVAVGTPSNLPRHRRPAVHGGFGPDPVWKIDVDDLPESLIYRGDPTCPTVHGFVEPKEAMTLDEYQEAVATSRAFWELV